MNAAALSLFSVHNRLKKKKKIENPNRGNIERIIGGMWDEYFSFIMPAWTVV